LVNHAKDPGARWGEGHCRRVHRRPVVPPVLRLGQPVRGRGAGVRRRAAGGAGRR
jgi:hypothetical protein